MYNSVLATPDSGRTHARRAAVFFLGAVTMLLLVVTHPLAVQGASQIIINPITPNPARVNVGSNLTINVSVQNNDILIGDQVIFQPFPLGGWPSNASITANGITNAIFSWTPSAAQVGSTNLTISAIELLNTLNSNFTTFTVIVSNSVPPVNAPVLAPIDDQMITAGTNFSLFVYATNTDNTLNPIVFSVSTSPTTTATITNGSSSVTPSTNRISQGIISWTPTAADAGDYTFTVTATELGTSQSVSESFDVSVALGPDCSQYSNVVAALSQNDSVVTLEDCSVLVVTNTLEVTGNNVTLIGGDGITNIITANNLTRLFTVKTGASLNLVGVTLLTGRSTGGGAIYIMPGGSAVLNNCVVQNNSAFGFEGMDGTAGRDDPNYGGPGGGALPGWPGLGGAILNRGNFEAYGCQFVGNQAAGGTGGNGGNGGNGTYQGGNGGTGGNGALAYGGAIYNFGTLVLASNCVFSGNSAIGGSGGSGGGNPTNGVTVFNGYAGNGGSGAIAAGGAICSGPQVTIEDCQFTGNTVQGGSSAAGGTAGGGYGVDGAPGASSFGGAICLIGGGSVALSDCAFMTNTAIGGGGGNGGNGNYGGGNGGNGGNGFGACLYNIGPVTKVNCTFMECISIGGTNGLAGGGPFTGRDGLPGVSSLRGAVSNIVNGLTVANPALLGGLPGGSYLPFIDPASMVNPDGSYAVAMANNAAAQSAAPKGGLTTVPQGTNAPPQDVAPPKPISGAPQTGAPAAPPAGGIGGSNASPAAPFGPAMATNAPPRPHASAPAAPPEEMLPEGLIDFRNADLTQVLEIYSMMVNRTLLRPANLPAPPVFLKTQGKLTMREGIQALEAVLALNGIVMVNVGDKFVKVLPEAQGGSAAAPFTTNSAKSLPDLGQYVTEVVQVTNVKPSEVVPVLQPFVKIPNGILPVDTSGILVLRDYAENVKRMLELIAKLDVAIPSEFEQEVIPIKYAKSSDIASALNSLSTGGSGTSVGGSGTSSGSRSTGTRSGGVRSGTSGLGGAGGAGGYGGAQGGSPFGQGGVGTQGAVTPGAQGGSSFTQRLQNIINRASTGATGDIQVLGQTKIISDERTNSLLVFASKEDMRKIKEIISKLDVVLAQVLIETVIIEVTLTDSHDLGFSYLQHPQNVGTWTGVGALNNNTFQSPGNYLLNQQGVTNSSSGPIPSGFSYIMSFGQDLDVAVAAVEANTKARILQRPRIQTSHNEPASIFVGESRPYPTSSYYGGGAYGGSSTIQQLEIGVSLDVTPLINPDGLVVMDIHQKIDAFEGNVTIQNVGDVPITSEKEAQAKVSVRDHDTIILGGLIETDKNANRSGVPFLMDLPIFGTLFRSNHRDETRQELIVLIRPTVLPTPEIAALTATAEKNKMPGVRSTERDIRAEESLRLKKADEEDRRNQPVPVSPP